MQRNMRGRHRQPPNGMVVQQYEFYCGPNTAREEITWARPENVFPERRPEPPVVNAYLTDNLWRRPRCLYPPGPARIQVDARNLAIGPSNPTLSNNGGWDPWANTSEFNNEQLNNLLMITNMPHMPRNGVLIQGAGLLNNGMDFNQTADLPVVAFIDPHVPFEASPYAIQGDTVPIVHGARLLSSNMGFNGTAELPTGFPQVANLTNVRQADGTGVQEAQLLSNNYTSGLPTSAPTSRAAFTDWPYDINVSNALGGGMSTSEEAGFFGTNMNFNQTENLHLPLADGSYNIRIENVTNVVQGNGRYFSHTPEQPTASLNPEVPFADSHPNIRIANGANLLQEGGASNVPEAGFLRSDMAFNQIPDPTTWTIDENVNQNTQAYVPNWMSNGESQENRTSLSQSPMNQPIYAAVDLNDDNVEDDSEEFLTQTDSEE
ncbi:uncharacterized protein LOC116166227 isoform X2 [Photinus pyralis]|uniref:uncharacterized protein LOC116166227 isoform X2 n=1 Tax=Photinus pyralis TaxID=7054 RepID=UPI0012675FD1|nr:uncharacterized protein LOC116166227 isoform X2 [Photinus pyralis]